MNRVLTVEDCWRMATTLFSGVVQFAIRFIKVDDKLTASALFVVSTVSSSAGTIRASGVVAVAAPKFKMG